MITTIPTTYKDIKFRSRLEARWAVFFDTLGITYRYEFEGFKLNDGEYYLPDFYLPQYAIYCEVKPNWEEVAKNEATFKKFGLTKQWLLLLVDTPNMNTTRLYSYGDYTNVVPFVNLLISKYGNFWGSSYQDGSDKDKFRDYNLFKLACDTAEKYIFY